MRVRRWQVLGALRKSFCSPTEARGTGRLANGGGRRSKPRLGGAGSRLSGAGGEADGAGQMKRDISGVRLSVLSTQISEEAFSMHPGGGDGPAGDRGSAGGSLKNKTYIPMLSMQQEKAADTDDAVSDFA